MPFSDEFDLDLVTSGNGIPGGNQPQSTSAEVTWAVSSLIIGSVLTGCTGDCVSSACSDNCSDNCTSANSCGCHVTVNHSGSMSIVGVEAKPKKPVVSERKLRHDFMYGRREFCF